MNLMVSLIIGGVIGWLAGTLGIAAGGGIGSFLVSLAGAAILIFLLSKMGVFSRA